MIKYALPELSMQLSQYMELVQLWDKATSCAGFSVAVGAQFFSTGIANVDQDIVPFLNRNLNGRVTPRVLPSYAILYWFSLQVS